jgi:hypothetical protein
LLGRRFWVNGEALERRILMSIRAGIAGMFFCGSLAFGQLVPGGHGPVGHGPGGGRQFGFHGGGKVVAGAPYSATFSNSSVKTLVDGNTIQRTTTGAVARDSQGRTYSTEVVTGLFGQAGTRTITFISDPVAGYVYTLNAETKTATRRAFHTRTSPSPNAQGAFGNHPERAADPNVVLEDKGTQTVNGVSVQGKSTTRTIPAGTMGNDKPIVSKTETWFSPDLQVVVSSTRTDPSEGTSIYTLSNVQRAEPVSTLFQVPADFVIKDAPAFAGRR